MQREKLHFYHEHFSIYDITMTPAPFRHVLVCTTTERPSPLPSTTRSSTRSSSPGSSSACLCSPALSSSPSSSSLPLGELGETVPSLQAASSAVSCLQCVADFCPGERNHGVPREACCSSDTTRYHARSCQLALNRANRTIEHVISGDILAQLSAKLQQKGNYVY